MVGSPFVVGVDSIGLVEVRCIYEGRSVSVWKIEW